MRIFLDPWIFLGVIAIYNIESALTKACNSGRTPNSQSPSSPWLRYIAVATVTDLLPTHYLSIHQSAIRALCWIKAPPCLPSGAVLRNDNPTVIASGGYDGVECLTDIREGHGSVMNRTRGSHFFYLSVTVNQKLRIERCYQFYGVFIIHGWPYHDWPREHHQGLFCFSKYAWARPYTDGSSRACLGRNLRQFDVKE